MTAAILGKPQPAPHTAYDHKRAARAAKVTSFVAAETMPRRIRTAEAYAARRLSTSEIRELERVIAASLAGEIGREAAEEGASAIEVAQIADVVATTFLASLDVGRRAAQ